MTMDNNRWAAYLAERGVNPHGYAAIVGEAITILRARRDRESRRLADLLDALLEQWDAPPCDTPGGCNNCEWRPDLYLALQLAREITGRAG